MQNQTHSRYSTMQLFIQALRKDLKKKKKIRQNKGGEINERRKALPYNR
jgi:hypothetical protein